MEHSYQPGVIVEARGRLWRVDQATRDTITGTSIDNPDLEPRTFYLPLEQAGIRLAAMDRPPSEPGDAALHDPFLHATRMTMMHGQIAGAWIIGTKGDRGPTSQRRKAKGMRSAGERRASVPGKMLARTTPSSNAGQKLEASPLPE